MTERSRRTQRIEPDWWSKTLAIILLSYPLALALAGLLEMLLPPGESRNQLIMWSVAAFVLLLLAFSFLLRSGQRAWWFLGSATLFGWTLLKGLQILTGSAG